MGKDRDGETGREVARILEAYRENGDAAAADRDLGRLERACGGWRVRGHIASQALTCLALQKSIETALRYGRLDNSLPHFYLALDHAEEPQAVRDEFFRAGFELVDTRPSAPTKSLTGDRLNTSRELQQSNLA